MFLLCFLSVLGEISIFKIFLFSSSCIGLAALLIGLGDAELGLDAADDMLNIEGFLIVSFPRKLLGVGLDGASPVSGLSSSSIMSELKDIWGVRKLVHPMKFNAHDLI